MRTYRTVGDLDRILAFDGLSYETVIGSVDVQDLLGFGQSVLRRLLSSTVSC